MKVNMNATTQPVEPIDATKVDTINGAKTPAIAPIRFARELREQE